MLLLFEHSAHPEPMAKGAVTNTDTQFQQFVWAYSQKDVVPIWCPKLSKIVKFTMPFKTVFFLTTRVAFAILSLF